MKKLAVSVIVMLILALGCAAALSACTPVSVEEDGTVVAGGVRYKVDGQFATVIGYVEGERRLKVLSRLGNEEAGIDAEVTIIAENAFAGADIDQVEFDTGFERLTIYPNAFAGSTVKDLEDFPYTNVTLIDNALAGMANLSVISVRGDSQERDCYYINDTDGGLYGVDSDGKTTLYLIPAAKSAANTYTITANIVAPGAFSCNKSINTVFVTNSVSRICSGAFANVKISRVSFQDVTAEVFVEEGAFEVDKDMRFEVSADSVEVLDHWIKLSDGEQLETLSGLIHPTGCTEEQPHIHGLSGDNAPATSIEGIPYEVSDAAHFRIRIGDREYVLQYLFTTFTAA